MDLVDSVLEFKRVFKVIVTSDTTPRLKPDPMAYLEAVKLLGTNPEACVGFEDSGAGITALNAAGVFSVAVHPTIESRPELRPANLQMENLAKAHTHLSTWFE